jgi:predicted DCC family thiol-disulfide oxidoreductase YuxK
MLSKFTSKLTQHNSVDLDRSESANRSADPLDQQSVTVWFDSACPLCVREIALMRRLDKRGAIEFIDLHSASSCPVDRATLLARLHARDTDGALVSGAAAFAAMWRALPLLRPLGLAARWQPLLAALEFAYRGFLQLRPGLQKLARRLTGE